jgi:hypothetical protein
MPDVITRLIGEDKSLGRTLAAATGNLDKFDKNAQKSGKNAGAGFASNLTKPIPGIGSSFNKLGDLVAEGTTGALVGAGAAAVGFGVSAVKAAIEGQVAHARLVTAVTNAGQSFEEWGGKVDEASAKAAKFGFENDEVENSVAKLIPATHDVGKAIGLQGLAMDIARQKGIDLGTATQTLVQVEAGRYTALLKSGILTKQQVAGFHSSADAVKALASVYGGAASRYAETFAGKQAALNAELQNFKEKVGGLAIPALTRLADTGTGVLGFLNDATDKTNVFGKATDFLQRSTYALVTLGLSETIPLIKGQSDASRSATDVAKSYAEAQKKVADLSADGKQGTKEYADAQRELGAAGRDLKGITNDVASATGQDADKAKEAAAAKKLLADQEHALTDMYSRNTDGILGLRQAQLQADDAQGKLTASALGLIDAENKNAAAHGKNKEVAAQLMGAQRDLNGVVLDAVGAAEQAAGAYVRFTSPLKGAALEQAVANAKTKAARDELEQLKQKFPQLAKPIDGYIRSLHLIPGNINTNVTINGRQVPVNGAGQLVGSIGRGGGRTFASGGYPGEGRSLVGEDGPEWLDKSGSRVKITPIRARASHASSARPASSGVGGGVQIYISTLDPHAAANAVVSALQQYNLSSGPLPVSVTG